MFFQYFFLTILNNFSINAAVAAAPANELKLFMKYRNSLYRTLAHSILYLWLHIATNQIELYLAHKF